MCRLQQVRQDLNGHLTRLNGDRDWSFILSQVGMFSFTGLDKVRPKLPATSSGPCLSLTLWRALTCC